MTIDDILNQVLANEGRFTDNPNDLGGPTNWGITQAVARANGYVGPMREMTKAAALGIYRRQYVDAPGFAVIAAVSMPIAAEMVDTGVNMGPAVAGRFLQRALNALVDGGALVVDGHVGPASIAALRAFLTKRGHEGERRLLALLNAEQGVRYLELCEGRAANRVFLFGWLGRIAA